MFEMAAISLGISALGSITSMFGASQSSSANDALIAAQQKAAQIQYKQMIADTERKKLEKIRQGNILRHQAIANSTAQGSNESSALSGAMGQVSQETSWNIAGLNQAEYFGKQNYQANQEILAAKGQLADAQSMSQMGSAISSLGGAMISNMSGANSLFGSASTPSPSSGSSVSYGKSV